MIGYSHKDVNPLVLTMPKMTGYVKTFKVKDRDKKKLMVFCIDDEKLLKNIKLVALRLKILKNINLNTLVLYDDRYIKPKIRT